MTRKDATATGQTRLDWQGREGASAKLGCFYPRHPDSLVFLRPRFRSLGFCGETLPPLR
jgi:hypothetical protein